jgi:hypothetical protein
LCVGCKFSALTGRLFPPSFQTVDSFAFAKIIAPAGKNFSCFFRKSGDASASRCRPFGKKLLLLHVGGCRGHFPCDEIPWAPAVRPPFGKGGGWGFEKRLHREGCTAASPGSRFCVLFVCAIMTRTTSAEMFQPLRPPRPDPKKLFRQQPDADTEH